MMMPKRCLPAYGLDILLSYATTHAHLLFIEPLHLRTGFGLAPSSCRRSYRTAVMHCGVASRVPRRCGARRMVHPASGKPGLSSTNAPQRTESPKDRLADISTSSLLGAREGYAGYVVPYRPHAAKIFLCVGKSNARCEHCPGCLLRHPGHGASQQIFASRPGAFSISNTYLGGKMPRSFVPNNVVKTRQGLSSRQ